MAETAILLSTYQILIPEATREALDWHPGQQFVFLPKGEGVLMMPMPRREDIGGIAAGADPSGYRNRDE